MIINCFILKVLLLISNLEFNETRKKRQTLAVVYNDEFKNHFRLVKEYQVNKSIFKVFAVI